MPTPTVSVLIPVFNGERFLVECLDSVLAQDFTDFEIVAIDDGSTDGSTALLERYGQRDARIRWSRNPRNLGIGGNWNACLRSARAGLIKFVLQDDLLLEPSTLRRLVEAIKQDSTISLAATASFRVDASSRRLRRRNCFGKSGVWDGQEIIRRSLEKNGNLVGEPSLALFRAAAARRGFDETFVQLLDLEMWFHLLEQGRFAYLNEPLCAFREHPAQQTEVNSRTGAALGEGLMLAERYCRKPWMQQKASRHALFVQMYYLRKHYGRDAAALIAEMAARFSPLDYAFSWLRFKLNRPFRKG